MACELKLESESINNRLTTIHNIKTTNNEIEAQTKKKSHLYNK